MPYSPIVSLTLTRAEAVVLRDFAVGAAVLSDAQEKNPALALVLRDAVAQLESELVEHHRPDYGAVLARMKDEVLELEVIGIPKDIVLRVRRDFPKLHHVDAIQKIRALKGPRLMRCAVHLSGGSIDSLATAVATGL